MAPKKEEPAAKKAKTSEAKKEEPKKEEPKEEEVKEEKFEEPDAPKDSRPALKEKVVFPTDQTTLNVVPTLGGQMLHAVQDSGMSYLLAGARANVGVKSGRYMFEVKIVQVLGSWSDRKSGVSLKMGFSTAGSSLFLGEDAMGVAFGSSGEFIADKKVTNIKNGRFEKEKTIAVVLNLDSKSPNANTVSLYLEGQKITDPKPLPEGLKGQPLFPAVTFRGLSIQVNFGPTAIKELPFKCRTIAGAANSDVTVTASKEPKDGKYEVVLPVAFPDEGTFEWLDSFLEKNPQYVELSDRKIAEWCKSSGVYGKPNWKASNDKPSVNYGIQELDNFSVRKVISSLATVLPRNYVVMEVKNNLLESGRDETLKKFSYPCFKKVAHVVMGKPNKEFKDKVQSKILKSKQASSDAAWKAKKAEEARRKAVEKRKKEIETAKKAEEEKKKKEGEKKEEEKEGEKAAEEAEKKEEKEEEVAEETEPPAVELTEEEKAIEFPKLSSPDLTPQVLNAFFAKFTTPKKEEGFDEIRYEWDKGAKADEYLQSWVANKKLTTRIDNLQPGQFFKDKAAQFEKSLAAWKDKQKTAKKPAKKAEGDEDQEADVHSIADINDAGAGVPLYTEFGFEDWELTKLRFELAILLTSFKKDCDDPDRVGVPLKDVSFYYSKYFKKSLNLKMYGVSSESDVFALIKDTVAPKDTVLVSQLSEELDDLDIFVKLTEENRRERQRRIDAGDETARLKFTVPQEKPAKAAEKPEGKAEAGDKSKGKGDKSAGKANKMTPAPKLSDGKGSKSKGKVKGKF